jgi:hypothetical protein
MGNQPFAAIERKQLSDLFDELGPEAPTLLEPWTTHDLAPARLRHRLGPVDMPLKLKRFRHVAVAIPQVRVSRGIAVSPRQQSA